MKCLVLVLLAGCATVDLGAGDLEESAWTAAVTACPSGTWCQESSPVGGILLRSVWAASADDVFAVGSKGTILRRTNDAWTAMDSGTTATLRAVWGTSSSDVWAAGPSGVVLHYDGSAWSPVPGATTDIEQIWGSSATDVWFVGQGTVLRSSGGPLTVAVSFGAILLVGAGTSPNDAWVGGESSNLRRWNGSTWTTVTTGAGPSVSAVLALGPADVWVTTGTNGKETVHFTGSPTWTFKHVTTLFTSLSALGPNDIWGAGGSKVSHWDGTAWSTPAAPIPGAGGPLYSVATRPGHAWAVGLNSFIVHRSL